MHAGTVLRNDASFQRNILGFIHKSVDDLLPYEDAPRHSENPYVDIERIAGELGIKSVILVPPESISHEHARLLGDVILVNNGDSPEERRFSVAHELFHFLMGKGGSSRGGGYKSPLALIEKLSFDDGKIAVEIDMEAIPRTIAARASKTLEKHVSETKADGIFRKAMTPVFEKFFRPELSRMDYADYNRRREGFMAETGGIVRKAIGQTIEEEVADYFAANLLVPTERFILWEDRSDAEIARAFGVPEKCIRKRREEEIGYELEFMTPEGLSSDIVPDDREPLPPEELDCVLKGYGDHVGEA